MTIEKMIEELLINADNEGIRESVLNLSVDLRSEYPSLDIYNSIIEAYNNIKNGTER